MSASKVHKGLGIRNIGTHSSFGIVLVLFIWRRDFSRFFDLLEEHPDHFFKAILNLASIEGLLQKLL
jgi:hypothetical protein